MFVGSRSGKAQQGQACRRQVWGSSREAGLVPPKDQSETCVCRLPCLEMLEKALSLPMDAALPPEGQAGVKE